MSTPDVYHVKPILTPFFREVTIPGSKSITLRALLLASLADGTSTLTNVQFGDDVRNLLSCLFALGYEPIIDEAAQIITLSGKPPLAKAKINVGKSGVTARFLTAILATSKGEYLIDASAQMKKRPMSPLLSVLESLGAEIDFIENHGHFPFRLKGKPLDGGEVCLDSSQSSQFLSALLLCTPLFDETLSDESLAEKPSPQSLPPHKSHCIYTGEKVTSPSYIDMTVKMMGDFGVLVSCGDSGTYTIAAGQRYRACDYTIAPDMTSASYFFAAALLLGGTVLVNNVPESIKQDDFPFIQLLVSMGGEITRTDKGISFSKTGGVFPGVDVDMSDMGEQALTLAALAPFATSPTTIRNVGHIRFHECDRLAAISRELTKMGIKCSDIPDGIVIYPGKPKPTLVETYDDHRVAMAFSLIGLRVKGIRIANPACVVKTFPDFFAVMQGS
ncbi:MAG: 3-phosphoshikimate 1-carboxyvinyltransferase [Lachnospiraceae bacterium]|jgi:3-phosphoshikimate 1-carboxyvinyltransferase|nr:3-phosphoshikimate 1-carboxyvinyltransferase [Lachnospiraceae bacterium]